MPREVFGHDYQFLERTQLLSFEEIERLARLFRENGVEKIIELQLNAEEKQLLDASVDHVKALIAQVDEIGI